MLLLVSFLLLFVETINPLAKASEAKEDKQVIFQTDEIVDENELFEKAKKEKKENPNKSKEHSMKAVLKGKNGEVEIETFSTKQLLKVTKNGDAEEKYYAETTFAAASSEDFSTLASESDYKSDTDSSISWRAASTTYYTTSISGGKTYVKLNYVKANWTPLVSGVSISNRRYKYANNGELNAVWKSQVSDMKYTTSNTNTHYPPSTWVAVEKTALWEAGTNMYATLTRNGSSWSFTMLNSVKD